METLKRTQSDSSLSSLHHSLLLCMRVFKNFFPGTGKAGTSLRREGEEGGEGGRQAGTTHKTNFQGELRHCRHCAWAGSGRLPCHTLLGTAFLIHLLSYLFHLHLYLLLISISLCLSSCALHSTMGGGLFRRKFWDSGWWGDSHLTLLSPMPLLSLFLPPTDPTYPGGGIGWRKDIVPCQTFCLYITLWHGSFWKGCLEGHAFQTTTATRDSAADLLCDGRAFCLFLYFTHTPFTISSRQGGKVGQGLWQARLYKMVCYTPIL